MAPRTVSDDEFFERQLTSDEEFFAADAAGVTDRQQHLISDEQFFAPTPQAGVGDYVAQSAKSFVTGAGATIGAAAKGAAVAGTRRRQAWQDVERITSQIQEGVEPETAISNVRQTPQTPTPPQDTPEWAVGQAIEDATTFQTQPGFEGGWTQKIAGGFGSLGANFGLGLINPGLVMASAPLGGMGEAAGRAVKSGASTEDALTAGKWGVLPGSTDIVDTFLPGFGSAAKGIVRSAIKTGLIEGSQEALQQFMQNLIAKGVYKPGQELSEDVLENFIVGGIVGKTVGGAKAALEKSPTTGTPPTAEEVTAAADEMAGAGAPQPAPAMQTEAVRTAPPFYSQLRRVAEAQKTEVATPEQWTATLRNAPGVKGEELEWTKTLDFLSSQDGPVRKEDLIAHLEENEVEVQEIVKDTRSDRRGRYFELIRLAEGAGAAGNTAEQDRLNAEASAIMNQRVAEYEEYTLPGPRENYRELLLTLPPSSPGEKLAVALGGGRRGDDSSVVYRGPHFDEPNVLAHVRFSDRADTTGATVLFIEEIQSDWHQTGRKVGYGDANRVARRGERQRLNESLGAIERQYDLAGHSATRAGPGWASWIETLPQHVRNEYSDLLDRLDADSRVRDVKTVPDAPFKTSWPELAFKRMLRWAADNGYSRIAWTTGRAAFDSTTGGEGTSRQLAGLQEFYDRQIPSIAKKWAKRLGGSFGTTRVGRVDSKYNVRPSLGEAGSGENGYELYNKETEEVEATFSTLEEAQEGYALAVGTDPTNSTILETQVSYIDVPARAMSIVQQGLPMFNREPGQPISLVAASDVDPQQVARGRRIVEVMEKLTQQFKIRSKIAVGLMNVVEEDPQTLGQVAPIGDGYVIQLAIGHPDHQNDLRLYTTATHELGHILFWELYQKLPTDDQLSIREAFNRFYQSVTVPDVRMQELWQKRDNAVQYYMRSQRQEAQYSLYSLTPESRVYWTSFEEWFAEQVASWSTTSEKPLSLVEQIFYSLGQRLRQFMDAAARAFGFTSYASAEMNAWLDSFITDAPPMAAQIAAMTDLKTQQQNQRALGDDMVAVARQPETSGFRNVAAAVTTGPMHQQAAQQAAIADRMAWYHKITHSIQQMGELNPHVESLQRYIEAVHLADVEQSKLIDAAERVLKAWNGLQDQAENLTAVLDDVTNMNYRTPQEVANGVARHPTQQEFAAIVAKHKLSAEGVAVFRMINRYFDVMLTLSSQLATEHAMKTIKDPFELTRRMNDIATSAANLRSRPYFPFMRFGRHYILVKDAGGHVVLREHVERRGLRSAASRQKSIAKEIKRRMGPNFTVEEHVLDESSEPLLGMPRVLLDMIETKLNLTPTQQQDLEQLRYEMSPQASFRHRFQHKYYVPGYSHDFRRSFAQYGFRFSTWYKKTKYRDALDEQVRLTRSTAHQQSLTPVKREEIANMMGQHLQHGFLNPQQDFVAFKAGAVFWTLGFVPMSALVNLSQTPLVTGPYLASKFGDVSSVSALSRAMTNWKNFWKKGSYTGTSFEQKAFDYAIKTGRLEQTIAAELASWGQGGNLAIGWGGTKKQRALHEMMNKAMWMFEIAEKANRRIAFAAALDLAQKQPNAKYVRETLPKYQQEISRLVASGFSPSEANAIVIASHVVDQTQFIARTDARPKFMRGKLGSLFLFQRFLQNVLFLSSTNKGFLLRYALVMMGVAGLQGLPGYDDLEDLLRLLGWQLFGKNFNLDREVRQLIHEFISDDKTHADLIMNGGARMGFGLPQLIDVVGNTVGLWSGRLLPRWDMSKAIGMGKVVPIEVGKLLGPPIENPEKVVGQQSARAGGVIGGISMSFYKSLASRDDAASLKRWEGAMPRSLRNLSKVYRAYGDEALMESRTGAKRLRLDIRDTEHLGELLGLAIGTQPLRLSREWERIRDVQELTKFYNMSRQQLMQQAYKAVTSGDGDGLERVKESIREFNNNLPPWARGKKITADTLNRSFRTRSQQRAAEEGGVPRIRADVPIARESERLYGDSTVVEERRVR